MAKRSKATKTKEQTPDPKDDVLGDIEVAPEGPVAPPVGEEDILGDIEVEPEQSLESADEIENVPPPKEAKPEPVEKDKVEVKKDGEFKLLGFEYAYVARKRAIGRHCTPDNQRAFLEEHEIDYDKVIAPTVKEGFDKRLGVFRPVKNQSKVAILIPK